MNKDEDSLGSDDSTGYETEERDEVQHVREMAQADTLRVRLGRAAMTAILLATACIVTVLTYKSLKAEQYNNFATAVS